MLLGAYNGFLIPLRAGYAAYAILARLRGVPPVELRERLGGLAPVHGHPVWIQAASVGETGIAAALARALRQEHPSLPLLVTSTTRTGHAAAARALPETVHRAYFPLDFRPAVRRAMDAVRPSALVLVETELWPNLFLEAAARGIPVLVVNGRISDRAFRRYRLAASLFRRALSHLALACVQTPLDHDRFAALGVSPQRIRVTGNIKFAAEAPARDGDAARAALGTAPGVELWVAGSTAEGEEEAVLAAFRDLPRDGVRRTLVLAPRRPERFEAVARGLASSGMRWRRRSEGGTGSGAAGGGPASLASGNPAGRASGHPATSAGGNPATPASGNPASPASGNDDDAREVVLLDTLGELASLYAGATAAFVGGTLVPVGGHNIIEPASVGVAPVFGPHVQNVRDVAARLVEAGGAFPVQDGAELARTFARLASDPQLRRRTGENARAVVASQAGALEATLREIRPFLAPSGRATA